MEHELHVGRAAADAFKVVPASGFESRILHAALEAVVTIDEAGRIVMINPAAQRMFGWRSEQAIGQPLSMLVPERLRAAHDRHVARFMASAEDELPMGRRGTIRGLRASGQEFPLEASISRSALGIGEPGAQLFTALLNDLSDEQRLASQVAALQAQMRAIFELAPAAIWITEADRIVFANRASVAMFGAGDRKALEQRSIYSLLAPQSHVAVRQAIALAGAQEVAPLVNERVACLDGSLRDVVIAIAGLPGHGDSAVQMVITDVTEHASVERQLEQSRRDLRRLSASLVDAREEERRRIARELHDELGQQLTALKLELGALGSGAATDAAAGIRAHLPTLLGMVDQTMGSVRRIATELRPLMLDDLGLCAAVEWLARETSRRTGMPVHVDFVENGRPLDEPTSIALFRICQEALTNIARHARAGEVWIELRHGPGEVVLTIRDDGIGFSAEAAFSGDRSHGLLGIRERALMLGGSLAIGGEGRGGRLLVRLPVPVARMAEAGP